jgi:hypothetical protein
MSGSGESTASGADVLPQFYRDPAVLDPAAHGALRLAPVAGFRFAAATNSIALGADEFYAAQAHYPIVFTTTDPITPLAIVGAGDPKNLFVTADGAWRDGCYVPAYVRRYPFVMVQAPGRDDLILAIDRSAEALSTERGEPLFADGKPAPVVQRVLEFCAAFEHQVAVAREFAAALAARKLLVENRAQVTSPSGVAVSLGGFQVIDETRFNMVPDDVILDWRRRGWLGLVYAHLMSTHRWPALARLAT